jgi:hypothetical protein
MVLYLSVWLRLHAERRAAAALGWGLIAGIVVSTISIGFSLLANSGASTEFSGVGRSL